MKVQTTTKGNEMLAGIRLYFKKIAVAALKRLVRLFTIFFH